MTGSIILRRWASFIRTRDREAYARYVAETGTADYARTGGNLGYQMLLSDRDDGTTRVETLSWWTSYDAIRAFAGDDFHIARYYPQDDQFLLSKPQHVEHAEVVIDGLSLDRSGPGEATPGPA